MADEEYYVQLLPISVKGPQSFKHPRTLNEVRHETFREASIALGLTRDDQQWVKTFQEGATYVLGEALRELFITAMIFDLDLNFSIVFISSTWSYLINIALLHIITFCSGNYKYHFCVYSHYCTLRSPTNMASGFPLSSASYTILLQRHERHNPVNASDRGKENLGAVSRSFLQ